jgi:transcriptional regulator with XRE-family HTH domain
VPSTPARPAPTHPPVRVTRHRRRYGPTRPRQGVVLTYYPALRPGMRARVRITRQWGETVEDYTIGAVARAAKLDTSTVSRIFAGGRVGKVQTLERIASAVDVSLDVLYQHLTATRTR